MHAKKLLAALLLGSAATVSLAATPSPYIPASLDNVQAPFDAATLYLSRIPAEPYYAAVIPRVASRLALYRGLDLVGVRATDCRSFDDEVICVNASTSAVEIGQVVNDAPALVFETEVDGRYARAATLSVTQTVGDASVIIVRMGRQISIAEIDRAAAAGHGSE